MSNSNSSVEFQPEKGLPASVCKYDAAHIASRLGKEAYGLFQEICLHIEGADSEFSDVERLFLVSKRMMMIDDLLGGSTAWRKDLANSVEDTRWKALALIPSNMKDCVNVLKAAPTFYEPPLAALKQRNLSELYKTLKGPHIPYGHWQEGIPTPGDVAACLTRPGDRTR